MLVIYLYFLFYLLLDEQFLSKKNWLMHYKEPWEEVKDKWKSTSQQRRNSIKSTEINITNILGDWPLYAHALGYMLVIISIFFI